jgi:hypothetical protein
MVARLVAKLSASRGRDGCGVEVVLEGAFFGDESAAAGTLVHDLGTLVAELLVFALFPVIKMEFPASEGLEAMRPEPWTAAAGGNEEEFFGGYQRCEIRDVEVGRLQLAGQNRQELDVVNAFDQKKQGRFGDCGGDNRVIGQMGLLRFGGELERLAAASRIQV